MPGATVRTTAPRPVPVIATAVALLVAGAAAVVPASGLTAPGGLGPDQALPYRLPVDDVVVRRFERPEERWSPGHRGIDIAAPAGTAVLAPADGVVAFAGTVVDRGVVSIDHPDGLRSSMEPLTDLPPEGAAVTAGQVVGKVAEGGRHCAQPCVHWGVRRGEAYLDPLGLLAGDAPVVLLGASNGLPGQRARWSLSRARSPGGWSAGAASLPCASVRCGTR